MGTKVTIEATAVQCMLVQKGMHCKEVALHAVFFLPVCEEAHYCSHHYALCQVKGGRAEGNS